MAGFRFLLFLFISFISANQAIAQCPVANSCTPGSAPSSSFPFGMGIYNVTIGSGATGLTNITGGVSDGYVNYSCTKKATVADGVSTNISVSTNPNVNENVRVWIDLNNNGVFDATSELVFTSNNAKVHTGTFTVPITAVKNTVLRMRIAADNFSSAVPTPCSTPAYSQTEDYGITIVSNLNKPFVDFSVNNPITCSPTVQFQNLVQNGATSYFWTFGDNTTSTAPNPTHTYATTGTYTVKLKACNANGCDSLTKINYVTYHTNTPIAASCTPATTGYCCGYGITKVTFHTMVNSSANGAAGYENFTCSKSVTVQEAGYYPIALETGTANSQDSWIYIDYNNNGIFEPTELAFTKLNAFNPTGNITIQSNTVKNTPLRMRVISDVQGSLSGPCINRTSGQVEDYTIITTPNTVKPAANFISNFTNICNPTVQFTNTTLYGATSYEWNFGDGSPISTLQNPQHTYTSSGSYTVKLKACNAGGCDSISKQNFVTFRQPCQLYCNPVVIPNSNLGITNVSLNTINNTSSLDPNGYGDFTKISTTLVKASNYQISITINTIWSSYITAWIDYNQDGDFIDTGEMVATGYAGTGITRTFNVPVTAKTGVTRMRVRTSGNQVTSCSSGPYYIETEDYSVYIIPNNQPPTALFSTIKEGPTYCSNSLAFSDGSYNSPASWQWDFGDPASGTQNFSTLQNPRHIFSGPGSYTIKLISCNPYGCDTLVKNAYISIVGNGGPQGISCYPNVLAPQSGMGIFNVTFNSINHSTPGGEGYKDYACISQTTVSAGSSYSISVQNGNDYFEDVSAWIDYNNDAQFDTSELAFYSQVSKLHTGTITIPNTAVFNQPLRMRIRSDKAGNGTIHSPCSDVINGQVEDYAVTISNPLGTVENQLTEAINIYPIPSEGIFYFEKGHFIKGSLKIKVYNSLGQLIAAKELDSIDENTELNLRYLKSGIYYLRIDTQDLSATKKLIIE